MPFEALTQEEFKRLGSRLERLGLHETKTATVCRPSFYGHGALLNVSTGHSTQKFIAAGDARLEEMRLFHQDGSAQPIHEGNRAAGIDIRTAAEAADYLRFFCAILRSEDGLAFNIKDPGGGPYTLEDGSRIQAPRLTACEDGEDNGFSATACVEYDGALFMAAFRIEADGFVDMTEDCPLGRRASLEPAGALS